MPHEPLHARVVRVVPLCDGGRRCRSATRYPASTWIGTPSGTGTRGHSRSTTPRVGRGMSMPSWCAHPDGIALVDTGIGHFGRPPFDVTGRIDDELRAMGVLQQLVRLSDEHERPLRLRELERLECEGDRLAPQARAERTGDPDPGVTARACPETSAFRSRCRGLPSESILLARRIGAPGALNRTSSATPASQPRPSGGRPPKVSCGLVTIRSTS